MGNVSPEKPRGPADESPPRLISAQKSESEWARRVTPGTEMVYRVSENAPRPPRAGKGSSGLVRDGLRPLNRFSRALRDLEALEHFPCALLTLTLPHDLTPKAWQEVVRRFLDALRKKLGPLAGAAWFRHFQSESGRPHLHIYLSVAAPGLLEWATTRWASYLALSPDELSAHAVTLEPHANFDYAERVKTAQAQAPYTAKWGKWCGFMGSWREAEREARQATFTERLVPAQAHARALEVLEANPHLGARTAECWVRVAVLAGREAADEAIPRGWASAWIARGGSSPPAEPGRCAHGEVSHRG